MPHASKIIPVDVVKRIRVDAKIQFTLSVLQAVHLGLGSQFGIKQFVPLA
jgi:hypothetical protein